jgi:hypothetical protein
MQRTNKETVKAHLNLLMGHLLDDWQANKKVINSLQYALRAVDAYNPNGIPLKKRVFHPQEQAKAQG